MDWKLILQIVGVVLGLIYLYLQYQADIKLWAVGVIMPAVHGFLYFKSGLYADAGMQLYYVAAGIWGFVAWMLARRKRDVAGDHGSETAKTSPKAAQVAQSDEKSETGRGLSRNADDADGISATPKRLWPTLVAIYAVLHALLYLFLRCCTDSTVPFWDAMTTSASVVAMWMLSRKYVEQWLVWGVVDAITVALYIYKGIPITACLYLLYTVLAIIGYRHWKVQAH